jgi:hypothetical protein
VLIEGQGCQKTEITQTGTSTLIDVRAGLIGAHFDTNKPIGQQVCFFKPVDDFGIAQDFTDDPNPVCEEWYVYRSGTALTSTNEGQPSITATCNDEPVEGNAVPNYCVDGATVKRTLAIMQGTTLVGTLEITYKFTTALKHELLFTAANGQTGTFTLRQAQNWSSDFATDTITQADGTEQTLQQVCTETNMIADLKKKITDLKDQGILKTADANSLIKHLDNATKELNKGKTTTAIKHINNFKKQVDGLVKAKKLSSTLGNELKAAADNIIANINNPVQTTCTITPATGGEKTQSWTFEDNNEVIVVENTEGAGSTFMSASPTAAGVTYEYGPFTITSTDIDFELDPATSTITGATADGHAYTGSGTGTSCPTTFSKDTSSSTLRIRSASTTTSASSSSAPVCAREYMQWDVKPIQTAATGKTLTVTDVDISFTKSSSSPGSRSCEFTRLAASTTAPGSRSASTIWSDIGGGSLYTSSSGCTATSIDLGTTADADLKNNVSLPTPWFGVGIKLSNDTVRGTTTDFVNINSANSSSKPKLIVVYTLS